MSREAFAEVPGWVWEDLEYEIARAELEYADNFRAYRPRDNKYASQYEMAEGAGCCGSFETAVKEDGERWIVGCNYGH